MTLFHVGIIINNPCTCSWTSFVVFSVVQKKMKVMSSGSKVSKNPPNIQLVSILLYSYGFIECFLSDREANLSFVTFSHSIFPSNYYLPHLEVFSIVLVTAGRIYFILHALILQDTFLQEHSQECLFFARPLIVFLRI